MFRLVIFLLLFDCIETSAHVDSNLIKKYYIHIYKAENYILHTQYMQANIEYEAAFKTGFSPFAADIYNSMLIGININDNKKVFEMAKILLQKGADTGYFRKSIFNSFRKSQHWKILLKIYPEIKKKYASKIDKKPIEQLKKLNDKDQELTHNLYKDPESKTLHSSFDSLYAKFRNLMLNNDYLSEDKVGIETNDTEISLERSYQVLFTHSFEDANLNRQEQSILFDVLVTAIHTGKIKAAYGHELFNESNAIKYRNDFYIMNDTLFQKNTDNILIKNKEPNLSSSSPTKEELSLMKYLYVDTYENIIMKSKYFFKNVICKFINNKPIEDGHFFIFGTGQGRFFNGETRNELQKRDKVVDICLY